MPAVALPAPGVGSGAMTGGGPMGFDPGSAPGTGSGRSYVEPFLERNPDAYYSRPRWFRPPAPLPPFYGGIGGFDPPPPAPAPTPKPRGGTQNYFKGGGGGIANPFGTWIVDALSRDGVWVSFPYAGYLAETPNLKNYAPTTTVPGRQDLYLGSRLVYTTFYNVNPGESFRPIRSRFVANPTAPPGPDIQDPNAQRRRGFNPPGFLNPGAAPGIFPGASPGPGRSSSPGAAPGAAPSPSGRTSPPPVQAPSPPPAPIGNPPPAVSPPPPAVSPSPKPPGAPSFPGGKPSGPPATQLPGPGNQDKKVGGPTSLLLPPPVPATPPGSAPIRNGAPAPAPAPDPVPQPTKTNNCQLDPCITNIQANQAQQGKKLDNVIDKLNLLGQTADLALLGVINSKLGPQIPGGISTKLSNFARSTRLDKVLNLLTFITVLHNALMLSTNLAQTLGDVTSTALNLIVVRNEDDQPIDVNETLGQVFNDFMKDTLGEDLWTGVKTTFHKLNRIVTSATNIVWTVRSLFDSAREIQEWSAENLGKIGNALKRFRVVGERAYPWMPEKVNHGSALQRRWDRMREGIDDLDEAASSLQGVLGEVTNITQEINELKEQKENFDKAVKEFTPKERPDNDPTKDAATASNANSKSPAIAPPDINKAIP